MRHAPCYRSGNKDERAARERAAEECSMARRTKRAEQGAQIPSAIGTEDTVGKRQSEQVVTEHGQASAERRAANTRSLPSVPDAFPEGEGSVPNNPLIVTGLEAMFKGGPKAQSLVGGWQASETGRPVYVQTSRKGGRIRVYPRLEADPSRPMPTTESLWAFVEGLSAFTGDVALAVLAQLCEPSTGDKTKYPLIDSVRITADAILRYKGIRRYGEDRRDLERRVYEEMRRLQALTFDVEKLPAPDPETGGWNYDGASWEEDRLFDIVRVTQYRQGPKGRREQIEVSWMVRAGQWAQWWLNPQAKVWLARMAHALLELDHRPNSGPEYMAKKLGQRIVLMNQAIRRGEPLPIRIDLFLEKVGELPVPSERGVHWARRTRTRFDEALLSLQEAGVLASVEWPEGHGPGQEDQGRGWVGKWLAAKVVITLPNRPPEPLGERRQVATGITHRSGTTSKQRDTTASGFDGAAIRAARMDLGWSQQALAEHIGISAAWLSNVESGKRAPSEELRNKLASWLADSPLA